MEQQSNTREAVGNESSCMQSNTGETVGNESSCTQSGYQDKANKYSTHYQPPETSKYSYIRKPSRNKNLAIGISVGALVLLGSGTGGIVWYTKPWKKAKVGSSTSAPVSQQEQSHQEIIYTDKFQGWIRLVDELYLRKPAKVPSPKTGGVQFKGIAESKSLMQVLCESPFAQAVLAGRRAAALTQLFSDPHLTEKALYDYIIMFTWGLDLSTRNKQSSAYTRALKYINNYYEARYGNHADRKTEGDALRTQIITGFEKHKSILFGTLQSSNCAVSMQQAKCFMLQTILVPYALENRRKEVMEIYDQDGRSKHEEKELQKHYEKIDGRWMIPLHRDRLKEDKPMHFLALTDKELKWIKPDKFQDYVNTIEHLYRKDPAVDMANNNLEQAKPLVQKIKGLAIAEQPLAESVVDGERVLVLASTKASNQKEQTEFDDITLKFGELLRMFVSLGQIVEAGTLT